MSTTSKGGLEIRLLDASHMEPIFALHNAVYEQVGDDTLYRGRDHAHIAAVFAPDALCFGAFLESELIGYSSVRFPGPAHRGRGRPLSLAIVGPKNVYSLRNFLLYGMRGVALHRLPTGEDRFVMARDHSDPLARVEIRRERRPAGLSREEIEAVLRSGGQLDRVENEGDTWQYEFVWFADIGDARSWVETFEARDFFAE